MSETFRAYLISKTEAGRRVDLLDLTEDQLMAGDVTVRVEYSGLNYKDGLAMTGKAPVVRRWPMIPGIDLAGTVLRSQHAGFAVGDQVVLNGFGLGEVHYGGYAGMARINGDWLVRLPENFTSRQAMAIGTAGYTAMLCVLALERHGIKPSDGDVLVTGAAGGVGSVAVSLLSRLGYRVIAATGRESERDYLLGLGAADIIDRRALSAPAKPLAKEAWIGAVDVAGGNTLANVLSMIHSDGAVAACGLADDMALPASVAPFILRGVTLYGIDSVMAPIARRQLAWQRLGSDLEIAKLETMSREIDLTEVPAAAEQIMAGKVRGRVVVRVAD